MTIRRETRQDLRPDPSGTYDLDAESEDRHGLPAARLAALLLSDGIRRGARTLRMTRDNGRGAVSTRVEEAWSDIAHVPLGAINMMIGRVKIMANIPPGQAPACTGTITVRTAEITALLRVYTASDPDGLETVEIEVERIESKTG